MDNLGFTVAAYVGTLTVLAGYTWSLRRRINRMRRIRTGGTQGG